MTASATTHRVGRGLGIAAAAALGVSTAAVLALLAVGGVLVPTHYLDPWDTGYADTFEDPRMKLVAQAVLAPSSHNEQPWRVVLDSRDRTAFTLFADSTRLTPEVDPRARQTMISQGTFLQYVVVAGAATGEEVDVQLFPEGGYDEGDPAASMDEKPVARITLRTAAPSPESDHAALFRSDTNRSPYAATAVTRAQIDELEALATTAGSTLRILTGGEDVSGISAATVRGTVIEAGDAAVSAESAALFRSDEQLKNRYRSGFAVEGQGTTGAMKYVLQGVATLLPGTNGPDASAARDIALATDGAARTPAYAVLTTEGNSRVDQVEAGMLYAAFSLRARTLGLVAQPMSQILEEYPAMRDERDGIHAAYAPAGGTIQMLSRLGTATVEYPLTMRRDAADLLETQ